MPVKRRKLEIVPAAFPDIPQRLLRIPQAAHYLNRSVYRIREMIRKGELRTVGADRPFVLDRFDLDAYIERAKAAA